MQGISKQFKLKNVNLKNIFLTIIYFEIQLEQINVTLFHMHIPVLTLFIELFIVLTNLS